MSDNERPGPLPGFAIRQHVEQRLQLAGLEIRMDPGDPTSESSSDSTSSRNSSSSAESSLSGEENQHDQMSENGDEANNNDRMQMDGEGRVVYDEVPVPELQFNFNNEEDRMEYLLPALEKWARYGVSTKKIDEILAVLCPLFPNLPRSYKTLLSTPRHTDIYEAAGGEMWYKGFQKNIEQRVSPEYLRGRNEIVIDVGMDGLPPFKYTQMECWPILGCLDGQEEPFVVAVYIGESKPNNVEEFLNDYVDDLNHLHENGIDLNGTVYPVRVRNYVCDAPARSLVKCIVSHTSRFACERCNVRGVKRVRVLTFNDLNADRRTDESFANREHPLHHQGVSPLENVGTRMVSQFVYCGLHLLHEGVFKRWLDFVLGTNRTKIRRPGVVGGAVRQLMSQTIMELAPYIPIEFNRRPRPLYNRAKYRATEFRRLFLYDGLVVFRHLPQNVYNNYLLLHGASYILSSPDLYLEMNDLANVFVQEFVEHAGRMFGIHFISYYIHCFLHFPEECARLGPVESFSAYKFENYLGVIKRLLRSKYHPLQQIANRDSEREGKLCKLKENGEEMKLYGGHEPFDEEVEGAQFYGVKFGKLTLCVNEKDCCFATKEQDIAVLTNIIYTPAREIVLIGRKFQLKDDFPDYPVPSSSLGIVTVSHLRERKNRWYLSDVSKKCVLLPIDQESSLCIPLLHGGAQ